MGLFDFINRHRYKFLVAGGAVGTVMIINKVLAGYEKQWQNSSSRGFVHEARKKEIHFENMINECNHICQRMYPKIIKRLQEILDDDQLIQDLAATRHEKSTMSKVEIWKLLKVKILTRLLSEIYCTCMMVCCMRVQMSVAGGQVFAKNAAAADNSGSSSASVTDLTHMKAYTKYVALLGSFYDDRLHQWIERIEQAVEEALQGYSLDYKIGIKDFRLILDKIKRSISFFLATPNSVAEMLFLEANELSNMDLTSVCPDSGNLGEEDEKMLRNMLAETQDIFESDDFKRVLESSIEVGYATLLDFLLGAFIRMEGKVNSTEGPGFSNPNTIQVPLAKVLPQIRSSLKNRTDADQRQLVNHLLSLDVLNCFAANVYEAFCVPR